MSRYEISKFMVYKFTVHCIVYSKLLILTSLQVYSTLYSLQQIVDTYKSLTNQRAITLFALLTVCFSTNQRAITILHCLHVQETHYLAFIALLLMELN